MKRNEWITDGGITIAAILIIVLVFTLIATTVISRPSGIQADYLTPPAMFPPTMTKVPPTCLTPMPPGKTALYLPIAQRNFVCADKMIENSKNLERGD